MKDRIKNPTVVVVDLGPVGLGYVKNLVQAGVLLENIIGIEFESEQARKASETFPKLRIEQCSVFDCDGLLEGISSDTKMAVVSSMTPTYYGHADAVKYFVWHGFDIVVVEKPTAMDGIEMQSIEAALQEQERRTGKMAEVFTSLLFPFSPTMIRLATFIKDHDLSVSRIESAFLKNRLTEAIQRAAHGVVHDLGVHDLSWVRGLLELCGQPVKSATVNAVAKFVPFVQADLQQIAHDGCPSISLQPASEANAHITLETETGSVVQDLHVSFVHAPGQVRHIKVHLVKKGSSDEVGVALINFDVRDSTAPGVLRDSFQVEGSSLDNFAESNPVDKRQLFIDAVIAFVESGEIDSRLANIRDSGVIVRLTDAILQSNGADVSVSIA